MSTSEIEKLKREFLEYLEVERGRAVKTITNYDHYLTVFINQTKITKPEDITKQIVREFRLWLNRQSAGNNRATGQTMSKKTQNYYLIAFRSFLKYLAKNEHKSLSADQIELAKIPGRQIDIISNQELDRLMNAPSKEENEEIKYRDLAILEMLFSTGLRVSELCSLTNDI